MAGAGIAVQVDDAEIRAALDGLRRRGRDLTPAMDAIGQHLQETWRHRFETGVGPFGHWVPSERAQKEGGLTLVEHGHLRDSLTHNATATSVEIGTNVVYAAIHQFGGDIAQAARRQVLAFSSNNSRFTSRRSASKRKAGFVPIAFADIKERVVHMPARPFLGFDTRDHRDIDGVFEILEEHLLPEGDDAR